MYPQNNKMFPFKCLKLKLKKTLVYLAGTIQFDLISLNRIQYPNSDILQICETK